MHNRLVADVFVPAGGRPSTIDIRNYKNFLLPDGTGTSSSKLIIEGANLFITNDARKALYEEAGVHIVKDSSANKTGVITSSYEICSAMLLSDEEFFENKSKIVDQILGKLRGLARMEAELLFREYDREAGKHVSKIFIPLSFTYYLFIIHRCSTQHQPKSEQCN